MSAPPRYPMAGPGRQPSSLAPPAVLPGKLHPRGRPAHLSESLQSSSASSSPFNHPSLSAYQATTSAPRQPSTLSRKKHSSESNTSSIDNAEKWFNNSNRNARNNVDPAFLDSEPPFYLGNTASVGVDQMSARAAPTMTPPLFERTPVFSIPVRSAVSKMQQSHDSNSEDYRSVIDDLTIENKKLKQKLRKYEKLHASHLEGEKLFEVKIHGLSPGKQSALEDALRTFAAGLEIPTESTVPAPGTLNARKLTANNLSAQKPPSSSTSGSRPLDSAYASLSASGAPSSLPSGLASAEEARRDHPSERSKKQNVQSYLHDIPEGLMPRQTPVMTEKSKKKLVVRRLEQLFTGKAPETGDYSQPLQQQEVSQSAAHADRTAKRASGIFVNSEGTREAHILPSSNPNLVADSDIPDQALTNLLAVPYSGSHDSYRGSRTSASGGDESPDQRPTRPLDLDLQRAQDPEDNIEYIRHLGLSSPKLSPSSADFKEDEGWVYLNLLTNMAQLHTINVTPEFVRKAVAEVSAKFDVSHDGRKIRWRGGHYGTRMSSDSSSGGDVGSGSSAEEHAEANSHPNKRRKLENNKSNLPTPIVRFESPEVTSKINTKPALRGGWRRPVPLKETRLASSLQYRPMFYHQSTSSDREDSYDQDSDSPASSAPFDYVSRGAPGGLKGAPSKSITSGCKRTAGGSLIFYRNSSFCTDLGGQQTGIVAPPSLPRSSSEAIGLEPRLGRPVTTLSSHDGSRASREIESEQMEENGSETDDIKGHSSPRFHFSPSLHPTNTSRLSSPVPLDLEVSGIGGVMPCDNFAINVSTSHPILAKHSVSPFSVPRSRVRKFHHSIPEAALSAFHHERSEPPLVVSNILSEEHVSLNPSDLPPPSFAFLPSSGDDDTESVTSLSSSSSASSESSLHRNGLSSMGPPAPPSNLRHLLSSIGTGSMSLPVTATTRTGVTDDSSEIDLLAPARALDPETIARREREFDSVVDKRFAMELPAGSSAATAGGGSGWASEYEDSDAEEAQSRSGRWCNPWGAVAGRVRMDTD